METTAEGAPQKGTTKKKKGKKAAAAEAKQKKQREREAATTAELEEMNNQLLELQEKFLSSPKKERKDIKKQVTELDLRIAQKNASRLKVLTPNTVDTSTVSPDSPANLELLSSEPENLNSSLQTPLQHSETEAANSDALEILLQHSATEAANSDALEIPLQHSETEAADSNADGFSKGQQSQKQSVELDVSTIMPQKERHHLPPRAPSRMLLLARSTTARVNGLKSQFSSVHCEEHHFTPQGAGIAPIVQRAWQRIRCMSDQAEDASWISPCEHIATLDDVCADDCFVEKWTCGQVQKWFKMCGWKEFAESAILGDVDGKALHAILRSSLLQIQVRLENLGACSIGCCKDVVYELCKLFHLRHNSEISCIQQHGRTFVQKLRKTARSSQQMSRRAARQCAIDSEIRAVRERESRVLASISIQRIHRGNCGRALVSRLKQELEKHELEKQELETMEQEMEESERRKTLASARRQQRHDDRTVSIDRDTELIQQEAEIWKAAVLDQEAFDESTDQKDDMSEPDQDAIAQEEGHGIDTGVGGSPNEGLDEGPDERLDREPDEEPDAATEVKKDEESSLQNLQELERDVAPHPVDKSNVALGVCAVGHIAKATVVAEVQDQGMIQRDQQEARIKADQLAATEAFQKAEEEQLAATEAFQKAEEERIRLVEERKAAERAAQIAECERLKLEESRKASEEAANNLMMLDMHNTLKKAEEEKAAIEQNSTREKEPKGFFADLFSSNTGKEQKPQTTQAIPETFSALVDLVSNTDMAVPELKVVITSVCAKHSASLDEAHQVMHVIKDRGVGKDVQDIVVALYQSLNEVDFETLLKTVRPNLFQRRIRLELGLA